MHRQDTSTEVLTQAVLRYAVDRIRMDPPPLDGPRTLAELRAMAGRTVTPSGIGGLEALRVFADVLATATISTDHPRNLSFVPCAPTEAAVLFDLVVGASSIFGGSWMEGGGAIFAENEALRYLADLAGLPKQAGGVFVSGGTAGNLSALIAARYWWRHRADGAHDRTRGAMLVSAGAHSSIISAARAMDVDLITIAADDAGRLTADTLAECRAAISYEDLQRTFAVVTTAGTTNVGAIDDLGAVAALAEELGVWMHVDAAYGGGGLAAPSIRARFAGIERADSLVIDPHKWYFAPFDCCALVYRDPEIARAAHTQHAEYLDVLHPDLHRSDEPIAAWNASDYAHHLTRRARGLPFWFSLATHGTAAYTAAIETTLEVARDAARQIDAAEHVELLLEPELSVVVFRRLGWATEDYERWSAATLASGEAFVVPTSWRGETVLRFCIVNPRTTTEDIAVIIESLR